MKHFNKQGTKDMIPRYVSQKHKLNNTRIYFWLIRPSSGLECFHCTPDDGLNLCFCELYLGIISFVPCLYNLPLYKLKIAQKIKLVGTRKKSSKNLIIIVKLHIKIIHIYIIFLINIIRLY